MVTMAEGASDFSADDEAFALKAVRQLLFDQKPFSRPPTLDRRPGRFARLSPAENDALQRMSEEPAATASVEVEQNAAVSMTREELEAHLKANAAETRAAIAEQGRVTDARQADFGARIDQAINAMAEDRARFDTNLKDMKSEIKADGKSTRITMIVTAVASTIAIVGGVAAFNATVLGNMQTSFTTGRDLADNLAKSSEQLRQAQELSSKTADDLKAAAAALAAAQKTATASPKRSKNN